MKAYGILLRLYPHDFRARFAAEMLITFERAAEERGLVAELIGLIIGAGREWIAKLTTDRSVRGRCLPDLRMMRPPGVPREVWFAHADEVSVCS